MRVTGFGKNVRTLGVLSDYLETKFVERGYKEFHYYGVGDNGFALVTRLERMTVDGQCPPEAERWPSFDTLTTIQLNSGPFSLQSYVEALLNPKAPRSDPELYRLFVVLVTTETIHPNPNLNVDAAIVRGWVTLGSLSLDKAHASKPFTSAHNVTILIYELDAIPPDGPKLALPSKLPGDRHVAAAGLHF